jgi:glycosyltransferase involved in cell wall biosynthesis
MEKEINNSLQSGRSSPKVSVIIPVYNSRNYIEKCLQSLINQTLSEIEIILIDDASTDNSLEILRYYEKQFPDKIRVIHSAVNQRQGGARNLGIEMAKGEYLGFVDSDDWVEAKMYELLYDEAIKNNSDVCYCLRQQIKENGKTDPDDAGYFFPVGEVTDKKRIQMLVKHFTFIQRYIYKRSLFLEHNIRFPEKLRYEDILIDPLVIPQITHISAVVQPLYNYFIHSGSTVTTVNDTKYRDKAAVCQLIIDEYKQRGLYEKYKNEVNYLYFRKGYIHTALNYIINSPKPKKRVLTELKEDLLKVDCSYRKNPYYKSRKVFVAIDRILNNLLLIKTLKVILKITKYNV